MEWRNSDSLQYLSTSADLTGDGLRDTVLILEPIDKKGLGLFAFVKDKDSSYKPFNLFDTRIDKRLQEAVKKRKSQDVLLLYPRYYGVRIVLPGKYVTACGKEIYDCSADDSSEVATEKIELRYFGIEFFHYDAGGTRYYFWAPEKKCFVYAWIDD